MLRPEPEFEPEPGLGDVQIISSHIKPAARYSIAAAVVEQQAQGLLLILDWHLAAVVCWGIEGSF